MLLNKLIKFFSRKRLREIEFFKKNPRVAQEKIFLYLVGRAKNTEWGQKYGYTDIKAINDFREKVPIFSYADFEPHIKRMMAGERNILWPGRIKWFAKSAGTTSSRSKFIPVSKETLKNIHFKGGRDILYLYLKNVPNSKVLSGQHVAVAGNLDSAPAKGIFVGDISSVMLKNLPWYAKFFVGPGIKNSLLKNWEEKAEKIAKIVSKKNITMIAGVPSWIAFLLKKFLETGKKKNIFEIWPNFELFVHGGVSLKPYQKILHDLLPPERVNYLEVYNASEGFFAFQDELNREGMLLMLDYGIFYEFLSMSELGKEKPKTLLIDEVKLGENYAIIISTNGGLWRYLIGDTVRFTSVFPHKVIVSGRTKFFINVFGEEVIVENAEETLRRACQSTGAIATEFTVGPKIFENNQGAHEWAIEFERGPDDLEFFRQELDKSLRELNSDYDAKRQGDMLLRLPIVNIMPKGTFYEWMKKRDKLGGQHKVPRLSNSREYLEQILLFAKI